MCNVCAIICSDHSIKIVILDWAKFNPLLEFTATPHRHNFHFYQLILIPVGIYDASYSYREARRTWSEMFMTTL